jgi:predicted NUDIX family NTP pyrophosphohydrolase
MPVAASFDRVFPISGHTQQWLPRYASGVARTGGRGESSVIGDAADRAEHACVVHATVDGVLGDAGVPKRSAGLLMYRHARRGIELLLVHPGGPFWARKDDGVWSIPKGEYDDGEHPLAVAKREFAEELGVVADGAFADLGEVTQAGRKVVRAFALEGDLDVSRVTSNTFEMEWPPKSGRRQSFPEVDRAEWFSPAEARRKILSGQQPFIGRLLALVDQD